MGCIKFHVSIIPMNRDIFLEFYLGHTKNLLLFPPALDRSLDIILKGLVTVELVFKGETKDWTYVIFGLNRL